MSASTTQAYKEVIRIISSNLFDSREVCLKLAQANPKLFLKLVSSDAEVKALDADPEYLRTMKIIRGVALSDRVQAIKMLRGAATGLGLKEAKDIIDCVITNLRSNMFPHTVVIDSEIPVDNHRHVRAIVLGWQGGGV